MFFNLSQIIMEVSSLPIYNMNNMEEIPKRPLHWCNNIHSSDDLTDNIHNIQQGYQERCHNHWLFDLIYFGRGDKSIYFPYISFSWIVIWLYTNNLLPRSVIGSQQREEGCLTGRASAGLLAAEGSDHETEGHTLHVQRSWTDLRGNLRVHLFNAEDPSSVQQQLLQGRWEKLDLLCYIFWGLHITPHPKLRGKCGMATSQVCLVFQVWAWWAGHAMPLCP